MVWVGEKIAPGGLTVNPIRGTANVNEYSARYSVLDHEFYMPAEEHLAAQSQSNRQGRDAVITGPQATETLRAIAALSDEAYDLYTELLNETADDDNPNPRNRRHTHARTFRGIVSWLIPFSSCRLLSAGSLPVIERIRVSLAAVRHF